MIEDLQPYPEYIDSGMPWLGDVPKNWEVRRNGRLFVQRNETGFPTLPILEVSLRTGVRVRDFANAARKQVMSDREKYKRACQDDIAYNMMRMWQGAVGVVPVNGLVSPAYIVARPLPETVSRYYQYLFRISDYMNEVNKFSRGIVSDRNRLYWEDFKQMPSPFPQPEEQAAIVRFLDHADRRIRRYIRTKRQLIALLNEQKQAIIHRAVTRGLDPNVHFKTSDNEFIGDIPHHWRMYRLRHVVELIVSNVDKHSILEEHPVQLCNYIDVYKNDTIHSQLEFMAATATPDEIRRFKLRIGDVIITKDSEDWKDIGIPAYVIYETINLVCGYHLAILRSEQNVLDGNFLFWLLYSLPLQTYFSINATGVTRYGLSHANIKNAPLLVPPIEEQIAITKEINDSVNRVDMFASLVKREIDLIREYRTRLIADVVTGKLDVRAAAARLPEEADEEPLDDLLLDDEEMGEEAELEAETEEVEA